MVTSDGQKYVAHTLSINGVTKKVLVPLGSGGDNFIPTPDHPQPPPKPPAVNSGLPKATVATPSTPVSIQPRPPNSNPAPLVIQPAGPTTAAQTTTIVSVVPTGQPRPNVVQVPVTLANGQLQVAQAPPVQNSSVFNATPVLPSSNVGLNIIAPSGAVQNQLATPTQISVNTAGPSTIIQTGALVRSNKDGVGNTVQFGSIAVRNPAVPTLPTVSPTSIALPPQNQNVFQMDSAGRLSLVSSNAVPVPLSQVATAGSDVGLVSVTPVPATPQPVLNQGNGITTIVQPAASSLPAPMPLNIVPGQSPQQPTAATLQTPDGKVFSIPNHLLPTSVANALTSVGTQQMQGMGNNNSNSVVPVTVQASGALQGTSITPVQSNSAQSVSTAITVLPATHATSSIVSSSVQRPTTNQPPYSPILPKPVPLVIQPTGPSVSVVPQMPASNRTRLSSDSGTAFEQFLVERKQRLQQKQVNPNPPTTVCNTGTKATTKIPPTLVRAPDRASVVPQMPAKKTIIVSVRKDPKDGMIHSVHEFQKSDLRERERMFKKSADDFEKRYLKERELFQKQRTYQQERMYHQERNYQQGQLHASRKREEKFFPPKQKNKQKDQSYLPPFSMEYSRENDRRRSKRLKAQIRPCSVVLRRLKVKKNQTINLKEVPLWCLEESSSDDSDTDSCSLDYSPDYSTDDSDS